MRDPPVDVTSPWQDAPGAGGSDSPLHLAVQLPVISGEVWQQQHSRAKHPLLVTCGARLRCL